MQQPVVAENQLIPYEVSPLPAGPWLVFAPHADDETFGMGGSLAKASEQGLDTHVLIVTDGALGGDAPDLIKVRQREAREATDLLGVNTLQWWSEPDRGLVHSSRVLQKIAQLIAELAPASVFFPGLLELHPDHRMTAQLVWAALQSLDAPPAAFAYEICVQSPVNRLIDISAQRAIKAQAMAVYVSQNGQNNYPELVQALNTTRTFTLAASVRQAEGLFEFTPQQLTGALHDVTRKVIEMYRIPG